MLPLAQDQLNGSAAMPIGPLLGMLLSVVVLALLLWGIKQPLAWMIVSVLAIAIGFGCLAYGISQALLLSEPRPSREVAEASMFIGGGAGGTIGGVVLLVVSLLRRRETPG